MNFRSGTILIIIFMVGILFGRLTNEVRIPESAFKDYYSGRKVTVRAACWVNEEAKEGIVVFQLEKPLQQMNPPLVIEPEFLSDGSENPLYTGPKKPALLAPKQTYIEPADAEENESYPLVAPEEKWIEAEP